MTWRDIPKPAYVTTMDADAWKQADLAERAIHVARSQQKQGVQEFPKGSNWGPRVSLYLKVAGFVSPAPWCAAFVTWCLVEAGADIKKLPKNPASTLSWWEWARWKDYDRLELESGFGQGQNHKTQRGLLGVQNGKGFAGHIWFCMDDKDPHATLEGNTNKGGSREGYGVFDRLRNLASMQAYPRWAFIRIPNSLGVGE